jgi:hypothetical protein
MRSSPLFRSILMGVFASSMLANAQNYDLVRSFNVALGTVTAMAQKGDTLFIGGDFSFVAQPRSHGTIISAVDGSPNRVADRPDLKVTASVSDGQGGWFVGGFFTYYNGVPCEGMAHMGVDGHLIDWTPEIDPNTVGWALAYDNGWVFTGGDELITAVDAVTGQNIGWSVAMNGGVNSLAVHNGILYVGGNFSLFGGQPRSCLGAIDIATGTVTNWNVSCNAEVRSVLATTNALVVGGDFSTVAGSIRHGICALNYATALCTPMNPDAGTVCSVMALANRNDTLYFGGDFNSVGGTARSSLAAVNLTTGSLLAWDAPVNAPVHALCLSNDLLMVGGEFSTVEGTPRRSVGAVDAITGDLTSWDTPGPDGTVYALAPNDAGQLFIGGDFLSAGSVPRENLAAISISTGEVLPWRHDVTGGVVKGLAVGANKLFVGGDFSYLDGIYRPVLAAVGLGTDLLDPWAPAFNNYIGGLSVYGSRLYAGGFFNFVDGQQRHNMASFELPSLTLTGWDPLTSFIGVNAFGFHDNLAYVGLSTGMAVADTASSLLMPFAPQIDFGAVNCFVERNGIMYFGGAFTQVNGLTRNRVAAVDAATGALTTWQATPPTGSFEVYALAANAQSIFVGGVLYDIFGTEDVGVIPVNPTTGALQTTEDEFGQYGVNALLVNNEALYVGSSNYTVFLAPRRGLAAYGIGDIATGVTEQAGIADEDNGLSLWPVPYTTGLLKFTTNVNAGTPKQADRLDASGRVIGSLRLTRCASEAGIVRGSLAGLEELDPAPGLYFVRTMFDPEVRVERLIIER